MLLTELISEGFSQYFWGISLINFKLFLP